MRRALLIPALITALAAIAGCSGDDAAPKARGQLRAPLAGPTEAVRVTPVSAGSLRSRPRPDVAARMYALHDRARVARGDVAPFLPLYRRAARHYGISWLLLASIHKQETAFSTAPGTYHGLNFARCCAGPMQFNLKNEPVSTWKRFGDAFRTGPKRPARYPHRTARHPSPYDDWDAILAAARLLAANGARAGIDGAAWSAAYLYYGPDDFGITYADEVVARALGWKRRGFCSACATDPALVEAVHAAWAIVPAGSDDRAKERERKARKRAQARRAKARRARAKERRERAERRADRRRARERRERREAGDAPSAARDDREDAPARRTPTPRTAPPREPAPPAAPPAQTQPGPPPAQTQPPPSETPPPAPNDPRVAAPPVVP